MILRDLLVSSRGIMRDHGGRSRRRRGIRWTCGTGSRDDEPRARATSYGARSRTRTSADRRYGMGVCGGSCSDGESGNRWCRRRRGRGRGRGVGRGAAVDDEVEATAAAAAAVAAAATVDATVTTDEAVLWGFCCSNRLSVGVAVAVGVVAVVVGFFCDRSGLDITDLDGGSGDELRDDECTVDAERRTTLLLHLRQTEPTDHEQPRRSLLWKSTGEARRGEASRYVPVTRFVYRLVSQFVMVVDGRRSVVAAAVPSVRSFVHLSVGRFVRRRCSSAALSTGTRRDAPEASWRSLDVHGTLRPVSPCRPWSVPAVVLAPRADDRRATAYQSKNVGVIFFGRRRGGGSANRVCTASQSRTIEKLDIVDETNDVHRLAAVRPFVRFCASTTLLHYAHARG
ncbi:unnamed protein product [Soboliphyme baturini]|uniref:ANK_REP_REGION domain-containing protein n=1 Tax=Soboliphyme baturini TaxID=241478 RepID=A0A183IS77_9BILA|nr:unnamed protein product [Soboliphyme baturini]